jgi:hypothetical protein
MSFFTARQNDKNTLQLVLDERKDKVYCFLNCTEFGQWIFGVIFHGG